MDREWKIGEDLDVYDNIFDPITFEELITTLYCNVPKAKITPSTLCDTLREIILLRLEDCTDLLKINGTKIIELAKGE